MNQKERFIATTKFQEVDRPFFFPTIGFWKETIQRWRDEGLPRYVINEAAAILYYNFDFYIPLPVGTHEQPGLFPPFARKVVEKSDEYRIIRDPAGKLFKEFTDGASSIPLFMEAPVKNMDDFKNLRWRLVHSFPGRSINPVFDAMYLFAKKTEKPLGSIFSGLFAFHRHLLGDEELMLAYFDMPELIHEMSRTWVKLTKGVVRSHVKRYGIIFVNFWEDMCFKSGPLVSPRIFREFMTPYYKMVIDDAKDQGIEIFIVDTDGDCNIVIPLFKEVGVNFMYPFEVQSGMDILKVREEHPDLVIMGGLDKMKLAGTYEDIEEEVMSKVPAMLEKGGYVPALDHAVPPEVPMRNFEYFLRVLTEKGYIQKEL